MLLLCLLPLLLLQSSLSFTSPTTLLTRRASAATTRHHTYNSCCCRLSNKEQEQPVDIMSDSLNPDAQAWVVPPKKNARRNRRRQDAADTPPVAAVRNAASASTTTAAAAAQDVNNSNNDVDTPKPFLLLLMGLPGSGKSTLAASLMMMQASKKRYVHVNQDILGNREKCLCAARAALQAGNSPIVDRCNFDAKQRHWFVDLAVECGVAVHCVVLQQANPQECLERCRQRIGHPTLPPAKAAQVIRFMKKDWRLPVADKEGIDQVCIVENEAQYQEMLAFYA